MDIKALKLAIIKIILNEKDIEVLEKMNVLITQLTTNEEVPAFMKGVSGTRSNISLEQMQKEQNYQPITYEAFRAVADKIEWVESLEELLAAVK